MDSNDADSGWFQVGETFIPSLPRKTKLIVVHVSPARWEVTYPANAVGLRWLVFFILLIVGFIPLFLVSLIALARLPGFLAQWIPAHLWFFFFCILLPWGMADLIAYRFRRTAGGVIRLAQGRLHFERGAILRIRQDLELEPTSRFEVEDIGGEEHTRWALRLITGNSQTVLATKNDLSRLELQWLCHRFNEFLGWEFPSHCLQCGQPLDVQDVDWPRRAIRCRECQFEGPSPDPFLSDPVPDAPETSCPSCLEPIWLLNVHRQTGGCRCRRCGWASDRQPPIPLEELGDVPGWIQDFVECQLGKVCDRPQSFLTDSELRQAFPTEKAAWSQLQAEQFAVEENLEFDRVTYSFRRIAHFGWVILVMSLLALVTTRQLYFHYQVPMANRHFAYYVDRIAMQGFLVCCLASLGGLIWWSFQTVSLKFTDYALQWTIGRRRRLIAWHTLNKVLVPIYAWPPMLLLKHGGVGLLLITPTTTAARALARLCQCHIEAASRLFPGIAQHTEIRHDQSDS